MASNTQYSDIEERLRIYKSLVSYFGKVLPAAFFQKTRGVVPSIERIHNLASGIFKPRNAQFALSISIMLNSHYSDKVHYNSDRSWWIHYSPKAGGMGHAANVSLKKCLEHKEPLLVLRQVYGKNHKLKSHYRLLGLGYVESVNPTTELFHIRGLKLAEVDSYLGLTLADKYLETALRLESLEDWSPFAAEDRAVYRTSSQKREKKFKEIVLDNYDSTCAVTGLKFATNTHAEAWGAHIIPKHKQGTDDPRNGLALSQTVHWAFDRGIFRITDQYEVEINPKAKNAQIANFPLMEMDRKKIFQPSDKHYWPHQEALAWHKEEVFDKFDY